MAEVHTEKKFRLKHLPSLFVKTFNAWNDDDPWRLSAVVAYYAVLSLPGLIVILINIVGSIWGAEIVQGQLTHEIASVLGEDTAEIIKTIVAETLDTKKNVISTLIGIASIIFGATGVFYQLPHFLPLCLSICQTRKLDGKRFGSVPLLRRYCLHLANIY